MTLTQGKSKSELSRWCLGITELLCSGSEGKLALLEVLGLLLGLVGQFLGLEGGELAAVSTGLLLAEITGSVLLTLEGITGSLDALFGKHGQNAGNSFTDGLKKIKNSTG